MSDIKNLVGVLRLLSSLVFAVPLSSIAKEKDLLRRQPLRGEPPSVLPESMVSVPDAKVFCDILSPRVEVLQKSFSSANPDCFTNKYERQELFGVVVDVIPPAARWASGGSPVSGGGAAGPLGMLGVEYSRTLSARGVGRFLQSSNVAAFVSLLDVGQLAWVRVSNTNQPDDPATAEDESSKASIASEVNVAQVFSGALSSLWGGALSVRAGLWRIVRAGATAV